MYFDLQGQLVPSGVLAGVLPSGQQPNSVLSQDDRSSAAAKVGVDNVGPRGEERRGREGRGGNTKGFRVMHEALENP